MSQKQLDVLAVGNVVSDIFIKLFDDQAKIEHTHSGPRLSIPYASKIPFDFSELVSAVGNASNAAISFARLGFKSGLVSNVGDDAEGREIISTLHKAKVDTRFVHINPSRKSQIHYVLWYQEDRTILVRDKVEFEYHWPRFRIIDIPQWIYFSSVGKSAVEYDDQIAEWLEGHPPVKLAFQPGTFQIETGVHRLRKLYQRAEILALNREEATTVSGGKHEDINDLFEKLHSLGPHIVMISDGHNGAYASDGVSRYKMPIYPDPKPPYDRTGAGDAFTSTFVAAIMKGANLETALLWAPINAMSVVQELGAQAGLIDQKQLDHYLRAAPPGYHPERLR